MITFSIVAGMCFCDTWYAAKLTASSTVGRNTNSSQPNKTLFQRYLFCFARYQAWDRRPTLCISQELSVDYVNSHKGPVQLNFKLRGTLNNLTLSVWTGSKANNAQVNGPLGATEPRELTYPIPKALGKMSFLSHWWDMLVPYSVT